MRIPTRLKTLTALLAAGLVVTGGSAAAATPVYDLAIVNGRVIDPETGLDAVRNIGVAGGEIARVTGDRIKAKRVINAKGLVVSPGFIDLHAHDIDPFTLRLHAQDGVTTALELEGGAYPIEKWYANRKGVSPINFGASASHGVIRAIAFGVADPARLTGELEHDARLVGDNTAWMREASMMAHRTRMAETITAELAKGALGVGYHIATTPGADSGELTQMFRTAAERGAPSFIHIRSAEQVAPTEAVAEVIAAAKAANAGVHVVHVNSSGLWETASVLAQVDQAQAAGLDVTTEVYPYTGAATFFADPRTSEESMKAFRGDYGDLEFIQTGERLTKESFAKYKELYPRGELVAHVMRQSDVDLAVEHPGVMIGSDGGAYIDGKGHPRSAGTFAQIFRRYVRERKSLSLMEAIAKVSYLPAKRLEKVAPAMKRRGRIQEGAVADITIFDPATIADRATYKDSAAPSAGIAFVIVAGRPVVDRYRFQDGAKAGVPITGETAR